MKRILLVIIALFLFSTPCYAEEYDYDSVENALPQNVQELAGEPEDASDFDAFFTRALNAVKTAVSENFAPVVKKSVIVLSICLICAILGVFGTDKMPEYIPLCACAAIAFACVYDVNSYINLSAQTIDDISLFSKMLLPAMCTAAAACGQVSSSAVRYAASSMFLDLFISIADSLIVPIIYAYLALGMAATAFSNAILNSLASLLKWIAKSFMTLISIAFTLYIGLSSSIASSTDKLATSLAKTTISSALPVVGGIISDAASSVVAGSLIIKDTLGAFGMIAVLSLCLSPFITMGLNYLAFKFISACSKTMNIGKVASFLDCVGTSFGMMMGLIGSCAVIMFISVISSIRAVTG